MAKYQSGPKRRVERVTSIIIDTAVSDSAEVFTLHTCEDSKTLIRAMADISISPIDTAMATTVYYQGMLAISPAGTGIGSPVTTQALDSPTSLQEIGRWSADAGQNDTNGWIWCDKVQFDTKAQRKLREADTVVWKHVASTANDLRARGVIYLWFKE
jgi:hypothetical protein